MSFHFLKFYATMELSHIPNFYCLCYLQNHVALIVSVIDLCVANFMGLVSFQLESKLLLCMETPFFIA